MGHISPRYIKELVAKGVITGIELDKQTIPTFCTPCAKGKVTRKPIPKERTGPRAMKFSEKIHTDVWGPTSPQSHDGKQYFITFTDDAKPYEARLETQHNVKIKRLQSDRGGEYLSKEFDQHLKSKGTIRSLTVHDTPKQNGVAERLNRTPKPYAN